MKENENATKSIADFDLSHLLNESNDDLQNLKKHLSQSVSKLGVNLETLSKDLESKIADLSKAIKSDGKTALIKFYHDHKEVVDEHLKTTNNVIKAVLDGAKQKLKELEKESEGEQKKAIHTLYKEVVSVARKYNHKYNVLKVKLELENAGVNIKNAFS